MNLLKISKEFIEKKSICSIVELFFTSLLAVSIPFWSVGTSISIMALLAIAIFKISKRRYKLNITISILVLFIGFYFYKLILSSFAGNLGLDLSFYRILLPFVILPFVFPNFTKKDRAIIKLIYVIVFIIFQLIIISMVIPFLLEIKSFVLIDGVNINKILLLERPYLGFFSLVSFIFLLSINNKKIKLFKIIYSFFTIAFLVIISARMSILSLIPLFIWLLFINKKISILIRNISIIPFIILIIIFFFNIKSVSARFEKIKTDPRVAIWLSAKNIYTNDINSLFGLQSDELVQNKLLDNYTSIKDTRKQEWFINERFNTHNQFIHEFLSHGFLSLILLILILVFLFMHTGYHSYGFILVLFFVMFLFVENVLHRQMGVTALVFYTLLFLPNIQNQD